LPFNRPIALGVGKGCFHSGILPFQSFSKRLKVGNGASEAILQPGVQLLSLPLSHHGEEALRQLVRRIDRFYLANNSQNLLVVWIEVLGTAQEQPAEVPGRS
jgi:hypothetical protein